MNHLNNKVNCLTYAARTYTELPRKTRGAYTVLLDLLTVFAPNISVRNGSMINYSLLYDRDLNLETIAGQTLASAALAVLTRLTEVVLSQIKEVISIDNIVDRLVRDA